jgi:excisionase family DNA binding protein
VLAGILASVEYARKHVTELKVGATSPFWADRGMSKATHKQAGRARKKTSAAAVAEDPLALLEHNRDAPVPARTVAEICGVDLKTVHQWATSGLIAHFRTPGRHLRFRSDEVLRFLEQSGYPAAKGSAPHVLLVCPSSARAREASALGHRKGTWVRDPYLALVEATRLEPGVIVLYAEQVGALELKPYVAALGAAAAGARIYLLGKRARGRVAGVRNIERLAEALREP